MWPNFRGSRARVCGRPGRQTPISFEPPSSCCSTFAEPLQTNKYHFFNSTDQRGNAFQLFAEPLKNYI